MQAINKEEMDIVDLDGDLQLKEEKAQNCGDRMKVPFAFIIVYGHGKILKQLNVCKLTFGEMSLHIQYNSLFHILCN